MSSAACKYSSWLVLDLRPWDNGNEGGHGRGVRINRKSTYRRQLRENWRFYPPYRRRNPHRRRRGRPRQTRRFLHSAQRPTSPPVPAAWCRCRWSTRRICSRRTVAGRWRRCRCLSRSTSAGFAPAPQRLLRRLRGASLPGEERGSS